MIRLRGRKHVDDGPIKCPYHCFRKGFISELVRTGAKEHVVKTLVGHSRGVTGDVYISNWAIEDELKAAVDLVPAIEVPE
jgi:site-specific recombinase XerD